MRDSRFPQQISDQVIFANVVREVIDPFAVREVIKMRASKHV